MAASIGWDGVESSHLVCLRRHGRRGEGRVVDLVTWAGWDVTQNGLHGIMCGGTHGLWNDCASVGGIKWLGAVRYHCNFSVFRGVGCAAAYFGNVRCGSRGYGL